MLREFKYFKKYCSFFNINSAILRVILMLNTNIDSKNGVKIYKKEIKKGFAHCKDYTLISAPPYFTTPERSSIISEEELNF